MRIGSLFSGAGGLDMAAAEVFGGRVVWHAEIEPAAARVLARRFPGVPNLGDVAEVDWLAVEPVDVLIGGFPCQDVSSAGQKAGLADGNRSGLWSHMAAAIAVLRPRFVAIENVEGLLSARAVRNLESGSDGLGDDAGRSVLRAAGAVLGDLASLRYDAGWTCLRASDLGFAHHRTRVFVGAHPADSPGGGLESVDDRASSSAACGGGKRVSRRSAGRAPLPVAQLLPTPRAADANDAGEFAGFSALVHPSAVTQWGGYKSAIRRQEQALGRSAPSPTESNAKGGPRLSPAFAEWLMGWPAGWVTDPAIGLTRVEQLKCIGNGVVPQQAAAALRHLLTLSAVSA